MLEVRSIHFGEEYPSLDEISIKLDGLGRGEAIDVVNWNEFSYKPEVRFNIAFRSNEIFLKFYVREEFVKAEMTLPSQAVWEDSCVEFFVSPANDGIYYNFEINPIGTCLLAAGKCRSDRIRADVSVIDKIRRKVSSGLVPFQERPGNNTWTITIAIPVEVFFLHAIKSIKGKVFRANFYKCGDRLTKQHYLTWNPVGTERPDFHQPEFFGILKFD
jgi:hypothetical protein